MFKEPIIDLKNTIPGRILSFCELNGKIKEGLCDPQKVVNLTPFIRIKH
jgi:hypothetical protein